MKKNKLLLILFALIAFGQMAWAQSIVSVNYVDENGVTQPVNAISLDEIAQVNPNGATIGTSGFTNCYVVQGSNVVMNGQLGYYGGINLILCDGAKLTINNTNGNAIQSLDNSETTYTLTIYVQSQGTGQLVATASGNKAIQTEHLTIHGGTISATGGSNGIYAPSSDIIINGGTVTAVADGNAIEGYNITINGGIVSATGNGGIKNGMTGITTLGYTNNTDRITATNYQNGYTASTRIKDGQYMITDNGVIVYGSLNQNKLNAIAGHTLSPYIPTEWEGSGDSADDPYIIASVDNLNLLSLRTNGSSEDYSGKYFKLGDNITYTPSTTWDDASSTEHNFTAIAGFDGHFDGNGHTISGLRIYVNDNYHDQNGLFTYLGPNAYIERLTISNTRIAGQTQVGAIAGYVNNGATVTNCHVTGNVAVHAKGHTLENHGGIVGINYGTISNCVSEATVSRGSYVNDNGKAGGIAGTNHGTLSGNKVFNVNITAGSHYGAIAGLNDGGTLTNNYYHACTVNGTANATGVGCNGADVTTGDGAMSIHTITKPNDVTINTEPTLVYGGTNYWKHGTTITLSGGLGGTPTTGWQKAYSINGVVISENSTTISHNFDMPAEDVTITIGEIHADWANTPNNPTAGSSSDNPYKVYFIDQLSLLATRVNDGTSTYSGKYFQLMDDLTYDNTEQNNYIAIGTGSNPFSGHFDGNHKTINGIRIYSTGGYLGVFGYIQNAEVKNLNVNNIVITGHDRVGSIVGECDGGSTITGCRVTTSTLTATGSYSDCPYFGGIAGHSSGITSTMSNNFVFGVNIPQVYHFGAIVGDVGSNQGLASNYYHNCSVSGTAYPTGIGRNGGDVTTNDGARPVFTVSVPEGVTATASTTVTYNTVNYYKQGVTVTLSGGLVGTPGEGLQYAYIVYGNTLTGSNLAPGHEFDMQNANAVVTIGSMPADWAAEEGAGNTEENPYKIYFTEQLDLLAARVNNGTSTYSNKYFKLMDDLTYSYTGTANENNYTAIGNGSNPFSGHFDGNQKTIEGIRIYSTGGYLGVFGYINNAEVKDLYVNDIEITAHDRVGSIVGECDGSSTITGCRVTTATLNATGGFSECPWFGGIAGRKSGSTSTMSNNFVLGITIPYVYHTGAIAGEKGSSQGLVSNYYHNCTVGSTAYPTGVGCNGQDVEGAKAVFTLTLADGISSDASPVVNYNTVDYCVAGVTINLSYVTPANPGYRHIYSVNDTPIANYGTSFDISTNSEVTVAPNRLINWETEYAGTEADPYLISNVEQWDFLASNVSISGIPYSGEYFKLTENISVTEMVGGGDGSSNVFSGTFDGDGHTITFYMANATEQYIAPFRRIDGATIRGLKLEGNVTSSNRFAGGIVAYAKGTSTVTDCVNSTSISNQNNDNASNGGIVGMVGGNGTINITGCVFNGQMSGTVTSNNAWSGILGLCNSGCTANISHCLVDPVSAVTHGNTIYRSSGTTNCSNCYYTKTIGNAQGKQAYTITGANEYISIEIDGIASSQTTIGVIGYNPGIKYDGVHYAASGETVSLLLDYTEPGYDASQYYANGTVIYLNPSFNSYPLNMPNADVVITADVILTTIYRQIEGYGDGTDKWAFIASPVEGSIEPTEVSGLIADPATDYDLYRLNPTNTIWENYKEHEGNAAPNFTLKNGRGYLYATKTTKTLAFSGTFNTGAETMTITDLPAGFNLVGNPFTVDAYVNKSYYTLNSDGSAIVAKDSNEDQKIAPCYGVIVEVNENETVRFNTTGVFSTGPNNGGLNVALTQANTRSNTLLDNAIVSFNEDSQLGKFYFGTQNANIYIPQYGEEYAIASSDKHGEMPLNFKAVSDGTYTLTVNPENIEMAYLHLIDNLTGNDVDLLVNPSYTFTGHTYEYASRFKLVFITTDAQLGSENSDDFAFISNGQLIVLGEGTLQVVDMMGRVISSEVVNGSYSKAINAKSGVYVLRLITGENVKTQKIVVR